MQSKEKKPMNREGAIALGILCFLVCGLLLTIKPSLMTNVITIALSVCLILTGIQKTVAYFKQDARQSRENFGLAVGLSLACFGLMLLLKPEVIQSILPVLLGMAVIMGGFAKAQLSFDLYRAGEKTWWWFLIGVAVSVVLGILSIAVPGLSPERGTRYTGIALLVEAVLDTAALIISHKALAPNEKTAEKAHTEPPKEQPKEPPKAREA